MANINKNIIMQAGAAVANATNKAAGLSASTPEPGTIISAIQLVNGGRTIGPDALAHFTESVRHKLLSVLVTMEPIQDFNGYDHPWPAGGGMNLFDVDKIVPFNSNVTVSKSGGGFTVTNGNSYVVSMFCDSTGHLYAFPVSDGEYTISISEATTVAIGVYGSADGTNYSWLSNGIIVGNISAKFTVSGQKYIQFRASAPANGSTTIKNFMFESGPIATAWSPYSNICPISGRTGLNIYDGPTSAIGDATTYSMDWTSPAGTVYAGNADIVTGDIKAAPYYASYNGETLVGPWVSSMDVYDPDGTPTTGAQVVDLGGALTENHITGQDIITLVGDNYIWSDSGDVTITE